MLVVVIGPPGAGKGTISSLLSKELDISHVSTGDIFREEIKKESELGKKIKSYLDKGELVPDEVVIEVVKYRLGQENCRLKGALLDGFPRTMKQAEELDKFTKIDVVLNFVVSDDIIIERLSGRRVCKKCGRNYHIKFLPPPSPDRCECGSELYQREDDKPEVIKRRLEVYRQQFSPIIKYYREKELLIDVDASPRPEEIVKNIITTFREKCLIK